MKRLLVLLALMFFCLGFGGFSQAKTLKIKVPSKKTKDLQSALKSGASKKGRRYSRVAIKVSKRLNVVEPLEIGEKYNGRTLLIYGRAKKKKSAIIGVGVITQTIKVADYDDRGNSVFINPRVVLKNLTIKNASEQVESSAVYCSNVRRIKISSCKIAGYNGVVANHCKLLLMTFNKIKADNIGVISRDSGVKAGGNTIDAPQKFDSSMSE